MQVAKIPIQQVQKSTPQQSNQTSLAGNDFQTALTKKLDEVVQVQQTTPNGVDETLDEAQNLAGEVIQIAVTPVMIPLMQVFSETGGEQPINAVVAVPSEVSPNILTETAELPVTTEPIAESQMPSFEQNLAEIAKATTVQLEANPVNLEGEAIKQPVQGETAIEVATPEQSVPINESRPKETTPKVAVDSKLDQSSVNPESTKETVVAGEIKLEQAENKPITAQATEVVEVAQTSETPDVEQAKPTNNDTPEAPKENKVEAKLTDAKADNSSQKGEQDKDPSAKADVEHTIIELGTKRNLVKISDSSAQLDAKPISSPQEQLVSSIKQNLVEGKTEYEMQLTPLNLGKITVKLTSENGVLSVEFHAENPKTQSLLNASASEIRELLQGSQTSTTQVVSPNHSEQAQQNYTQQESKQEKNQQNQQNHNPQAEQSENNETSTVDFLSILQQLKEQSRLARI